MQYCTLVAGILTSSSDLVLLESCRWISVLKSPCQLSFLLIVLHEVSTLVLVAQCGKSRIQTIMLANCLSDPTMVQIKIKLGENRNGTELNRRFQQFGFGSWNLTKNCRSWNLEWTIDFDFWNLVSELKSLMRRVFEWWRHRASTSTTH